MKRFFRLFTLRRGAFAVATLATLIAAFYVIENWRGERAWTAAKDRLRAAGESVTIEEWLPKPPPDDENFMLNPVFMRRHGFGQATTTKPDGGYFQLTQIKVAEDNRPVPFPYEALGGCDGSWKTDMVAIAAFLPEPLRPPAGATQHQAAQAVLQWVEQCEPDFAVLIEAARTRPASHIPWLPEEDLGGRWQSLTGWLDLAKLLQLRALAQATAGDGKSALDSISLLLHLGHAAAAEPTLLVNYVLSAATIALVAIPLNHCLASHVWTDAELEQMDGLLRRLDLRSDLRRAWRGERVYFSSMVEKLIARDGDALTRVLPHVPWSTFTLFPRGWMRQNLVRAADWQLEQEQRIRRPAHLRPTSRAELAASLNNPCTALFCLLVKATSGIETHIDTIEATFTLAGVAIALERERLARGSHPQAEDALATLFPEGKPIDPFSGKPLSYAIVNGQPRIWSVGVNQRDDQGREDSKGADDIVWAYP